MQDRAEPGGGLGERCEVSKLEATDVIPNKFVATDVLPNNIIERGSGRFSEGVVTLSGVAQLRESLGRRRSRGTQDLQSIAAPKLQRQSLKLGKVEPLSGRFSRLRFSAEGGGSGRAPLGSLGRGPSSGQHLRTAPTRKAHMRRRHPSFPLHYSGT